VIGAIDVDVFHTQVAVFKSDKQRQKFLRGVGFSDVPKHSIATIAAAHMDVDSDGVAWFSMVIKPSASLAALAHECVHIADWIMERFGIPCGAENTEIRGYLVEHLFGAAHALIEGKQ
jgi:hypothetical protein